MECSEASPDRRGALGFASDSPPCRTRGRNSSTTPTVCPDSFFINPSAFLISSILISIFLWFLAISYLGCVSDLNRGLVGVGFMLIFFWKYGTVGRFVPFLCYIMVLGSLHFVDNVGWKCVSSMFSWFWFFFFGVFLRTGSIYEMLMECFMFFLVLYNCFSELFPVLLDC